MTSKQIYFISDIHLGIDTHRESSAEREERLSHWLLEIAPFAEEIYFLGDTFDYWFEFPKAPPPQYPLFYEALRKVRGQSVSIYFFTGNHDMWLRSYFTNEFDIPVITDPLVKLIKGKQFYLAHGDGLGKGDYAYKLLKTIMRNSLSMTLYSLLPPRVGYGLMRRSSQKSRETSDSPFSGFEQERLVGFCHTYQESHKIDYYIMGHRHLPIDYEIENDVRYINLGDWLLHDTYAVFDGDELRLECLTKSRDAILTNRG